jgi:hypothetical protein
MTSSASMMASTASTQEAGRGSSSTATLHSITVKPAPFSAAKTLLLDHHYLHSFPGGTQLTFGVFVGSRLLGAITLGAGPFLAYQMVEGATPDDCLCLTRLWLSDDLPHNSESRVLGIVLRALRRDTNLKFIVAYSDPSVGHAGVVYQASNWLYTGLSSAMAAYDFGDGVARHSRTVGQILGSHSVKHLRACGLTVKLVPQAAKHRYIYLLDPAWHNQLNVPVLPYPKDRSEA